MNATYDDSLMAVATPPPAIVQIADRTRNQERGIVVYRLHRVFDVHAGPSHRHDDSVLGIVSQDGTTVKVRVVRATIGGKSADASTSAQIEHQYEHPAPGDLFDRPFDPRYMNDYSFQQAGADSWHFSSSIHDSSHGDGTMSLNAAGDVVKYQYRPYVLPKYSTSGTVTVDRSQVLPQYWAMTRELYQYSGHYAIFAAAATADITYDSYARYPTLAAAEAALQAIAG